MKILEVLLLLGAIFLTVVLGNILFIYIGWWSVIPTSIFGCGIVAILLAFSGLPPS
jgi:hypothetical protein